MTKSKQFYLFYFVILSLLILNFFPFENNESSILATARHYADNSWINSDWWLSTGIEYGSLFNFFAGNLYKASSYFTTFVLGKLITYALWSYILVIFVKSFRISFYLIPLLIFFLQKNASLGFGEWMFTGFETKAFAYLSFLTALLAIKKNRLIISFFLIGLSISFHVLIGLYLTFALFLILLLDHSLSRRLNFKKIFFLKYLPFFILGSIAGIMAIIKWKLSAQDTDPDILNWGAIIYVTKRVSHHVIYEFRPQTVVSILGFFILGFLYKKKCQESIAARLLIGVTFATILYFIIGIIITKLNLLSYLKFYFFRTPDVLIPFTTAFLLFSIISTYLKKLDKTKRLTQILILLFLIGFSRSAYKCYKGGILFYQNLNERNDSAYQWIKKNTLPTDTFIVEATNQSFYVNAERPIYVAFKHSPQKEKHIVEWYKRLSVLNGGVEPTGSSWDLPLMINEHFKKLDPQYLRQIMQQNKIKYIFVKKDITFNLPLMHSGERFNIYSP